MKLYRAAVIVAMFALVYFVLTWMHDAMDLSRRGCNSGTVESLFTGCKVVRP